MQIIGGDSEELESKLSSGRKFVYISRQIEDRFVDAVLALRRWEHLARSQLSKASGTGQLFSPMILPTDF